jgi:hypothetical protein
MDGTIRKRRPSLIWVDSLAKENFPETMNCRLAFAARRLRMRRLIISTLTEKTRGK